MKVYQQPQAHHWIALRLVRGYARAVSTHNRDCTYAVVWLMREVGYKQLNNMIEQLQGEMK
jgi:hypothetical protein